MTLAKYITVKAQFKALGYSTKQARKMAIRSINAGK